MEHLLSARSKAVLQSLSFQRPNDAQAHGTGHHSAQVQKKKQPAGHHELYVEGARSESESRSQMAIWGLRRAGAAARLQLGQGENTFGGSEKSSSLRTAGAFGDMIEQEALAQQIQLEQPGRLAVSRGHERERSPTELAQTCFNKGVQFNAISHFTMMPGSFKTSRMGKATGGKS